MTSTLANKTKSLQSHRLAVPVPDSSDANTSAEAIPASALTSGSVEWLWDGRIPRGAVTLLAGNPGVGKSLLTCELAARLSRGEIGGRSGISLLATAEDSLEVTVKPRLEAASANLELVRLIRMNRDGIEGGLTLPDHMDQLERLVDENDAKLVTIDPLVAHLPGAVNTWQDQSVRRALTPLYHLSEESGAAIVVVAHLNKGQDVDPLRRIGGSVGLPAAARSVLLLANDPDDPAREHGRRRVLAHVKSNLGPLMPSLLYELEPTVLSDDSRLETVSLREIGTSRYRGPELLAQSTTEPVSAQETAKALLRSELAAGPRPAKEIQALALKTGISRETLKRAKKEARVVSEKVGLVGWQWKLPNQPLMLEAGSEERGDGDG